MPVRYDSSVFRVACALALMLVLGACTPGGQFDPTQIFNSDMFDSKTKLKGQRIPLFPNGVPGTTTGVPADLVKGYQPPPDQDADANAAVQSAPPAPAPKPAERQKPKPKVAVGQPHARSARVERPPKSTPTRIDIGAKGAPPPSTQQPSQAGWPNSPPAAASSQQGGQFAWPAPPPSGQAQQAAQPSQSIWPAPPSTSPAKPAAAPSAAPNSQSGQSFDSMWPKSTAGGASTP
jgi:hypothetical protein